MNDSYTYKCPSCGAKVVYIEKDRHWKCEYCKNTYTNLFPIESEELKDVDEYTTFNYYYCDSCKIGYYTKEKDSVCYKCHGKVTGKKEKIAGTISRSYNSNQASVLFNRNFNRFREHLPNCFFNTYNVINTYFSSDLYSGYIIVHDDVNLVKYFFINVLIPHIKTDNYRILYDFANVGFSSIDNYEVDPKYNYVVDSESHDLEMNNDDVKGKMIEACKFSFIERYGNNNVKVVESLECKKNILLRSFYASFIYQGKEYRNYAIGDFSKYSLNKDSVCLDFPYPEGINDSNVIDTYKKTKSTSNTLWGLGLFGLIGAIPFTMMIIVFLTILGAATGSAVITASLLVLSFVICGAVFVLGGVCAYFGYKKRVEAEYLWYSINATERDFYYNLVNNSNFVKKVNK